MGAIAIGARRGEGNLSALAYDVAFIIAQFPMSPYPKEPLQSLKSSPRRAPTIQSYQAFSKAGDRDREVLQRFPNFRIRREVHLILARVKERHAGLAG